MIFAFKRPQDVSDFIVGPCAAQMISIQFFRFLNIKLDTSQESWQSSTLSTPETQTSIAIPVPGMIGIGLAFKKKIA